MTESLTGSTIAKMGQLRELILNAIVALIENAYPGGICWFLSRVQKIATQIISFTRANLGFAIPDEMEARERVKFIWRRWPEGTALIVIDDVTDYDAIAPYRTLSAPQFKGKPDWAIA